MFITLIAFNPRYLHPTRTGCECTGLVAAVKSSPYARGFRGDKCICKTSHTVLGKDEQMNHEGL